MSRRLRSAPLHQEKGRSGSAEIFPETASRREVVSHDSRFVELSLPFVSRFFACWLGLAAFLLLIAAAGLVAGLVAGLPGLALYGGVFLVVLLVAARSEGML